MEVGQYATVSAATREHGNSYLAIMEGVGLLGVVPFIALVLALALKVGGVFVWLRRTANFRHFSVPVAMVLAAGLIHAGFEDWLFAVGYYLSVFFWVLAFAFMDLLPSEAPAAAYRLIRNPDFGSFGTRRACSRARAMMHLFVNGLAASAGGGLTYLRNVLPQLSVARRRAGDGCSESATASGILRSASSLSR